MNVRLHSQWLVAVMSMAIVATDRVAGALDTLFTYQGQVLKDGVAYTGICDFQFQLFDAPSGGTAVTVVQTTAGQTVSNGVFTLTPNFGAAPFSGADRWVEVAVRCPDGSGSYATLSPRQQLTATPYSFYAPSAVAFRGLA